VGAIYGADSKEYEAARKSVLDTERQIQAQLLQIKSISAKADEARALAGINADQTAAQQRVAMGKETQEELLVQEQEFENRRFAIKKKALDDELALQANNPDASPVKVAELNAQLEQIETQHQASITKIKNQAALEQNKIFANAAKSMEASFQQGLAGILQGTTSISGGLRNIWTGTTKAITNAFAQMVTQNIAHMFMQHAVGREISLKEITANAAKAASSAFSAVAGIPYIGPFLAPAAAAAAFAGALAFGAEVSAAGGADIGNVAPIAQLHPKEMVLPEGLADRVRKITEPGAAAGGAASGKAPNISFPGKDLGNHYLMQKDDLYAAIRMGFRDGHLKPP
jgi:hypothetical protein